MTAPHTTTWFPKEAPVVIIAGGAGFLGSHLCKSLVAENLNVLCLDTASVSRKGSIEHLTTRPNFAYLQHDIIQSWPAHFPIPQFLFHLVGIDEFLSGEELSLQLLLVNALGTHRLVQVAREYHARFCLASSVHVYEGAISSLSLKHYAGPHPADLDRFTHHEAKRFAEALVAQAFTDFEINARIVRLPEVYGPGMNLSGSGQLNQLFNQAVQSGELRLEGDGSQMVLPLAASDAVSGLTHALFDRGTEGGIYHLVPQQAVSLADVAHTIQKAVHPRPLSIRFVAPSTSTALPLRQFPPPDTLHWKPQVSLEEGIRTTLASLGVPLAIHEPEPPALSPKASSQLIKEKQESKRTSFLKPQKATPTRRLIFMACAAIAVLIVLWPIVGLGASVVLGGASLAATKKAMQQGSPESIRLASGTYAHFARARLFGERWEEALSLLGRTRSASDLGDTLYALDEASLAYLHVAKAQEGVIHGLTELAAPAASDTTAVYHTARTDIDIADHKLAVAEAGLREDKHLPWGISLLIQPKAVLGEIQKQRSQLNKLRAATQFLPQFLSQQERKEYLILLVDNEVLRPGGGTITALGVMGVEKGHITEVAFSPLQELEETITAVKPPVDYSRMMGNSSWPLRDWLWWADVPTSTQAVELLFEKASGRLVDGVILIDYTAVQALLQTVGMSADLDKNQGGKERYVQGFQEVFKKVVRGNATIWSPIGATLSGLLEEKHVFMHSNDPTLGTLIKDLGGSGAFLVPDTNVLPQAYIETSIDAEPSSEIVRTVQRSVRIGDDLTIEERIRVTLTSDRPRSIFASVWLPTDYHMSQIEVDGRAVEGVLQEESGWKSAGVAISLTGQEPKTVQVIAKRATPVRLEKRSTLTLLTLKQPGAQKSSLSVRLALPNTVIPTSVRPEAAVVPEGIVWEGTLDTDKFFSVTFP